MDQFKDLKELISVLLSDCKTKEQTQKMSFKIMDIVTEAALKKIEQIREDNPQEKLEDIIADLSKDKPVPKIKEPDKKITSDHIDDQLSIF